MKESAEPAGHEVLRTVFLERIAHELRGPAGVTLGALDELELSLELGQLEKLKTLLHVARRGSERVLRTADKLDRAGQLERGHVDWALETRDLREIVAKATTLAEQAERRRGINVSVAAPESACMAALDATWMTSAVHELVINAIRHARSSVHVQTALAAGEITVSVKDDGPGFKVTPGPRFQAAPHRGGLGLSLALVRDVAQAHAGRLIIEVLPESGQLNSGGRVSLVLPSTHVGA